jgi:rhodanese-related sulfurtransferase
VAGPLTADDLLAEARHGLERLGPSEAAAAVAAGALLVDVRSELQRERDGAVPGSLFFPRNVLEWRCDPESPARDERVCDRARQLIVMCDEGYQSSLAAANLRRLGFERATDLAGGFQAWRAAGLPVDASSSQTSALTRRSISSRVARTSSTGRPFGSSSSQST